MMRIMRENPAFVLGVIIFVVAAFIGTIFLVYGLQSSGGGGGPAQGSVVAVVEGVEIPYVEYTKTYNGQVDFYRQFYPGLSLKEMEERFDLKKRSLDSLVNARLLLVEAERMGLRISDKELRRKIEGTALFQEGGRFDPVKYRQILGASRVAPGAYEESQRLEMLTEKVRNIVQEAAQVTEGEVLEAYRKDKEKVSLELLALPFESYRGWVSVESGEVEDYYDENAEEYRRPERVKASYITIKADSLMAEVKASEDDLKAYYDENIDRWETPAQVKARHVLIKTVPGDDETRKSELRERAQFVLDKALEGADFAELAKEFSQDGSGPDGGDLGWFGPGQMVPAFEDAAFDMDPGEISEIVETEFGFHIIKVEDVRAEGVKEFEDVRAEVEELYRRDRSLALAEKKADQVNESLYDEEFSKVASDNGLDIQTVERLTRQDPLPGIAYSPEVTEELFTLEDGEISEIHRQGRDFYIFQAVEKKASFVPSLDAVRGDVEADVLLEKAGEKAAEEGRDYLRKLRDGEKFADLARQVKGEVKKTEFFSRIGFVPEAGTQGETFAAAFDIDEGGYGGPVTSGEKVWIFRVAERQDPPTEGFEEEKTALIDRLQEQKRERLFSSWLADLKAKRSIEINESLIY